MDYILIYDKIEHIDITLWENFPLIFFIIVGIVFQSMISKKEEILIKIIIMSFFIISFLGITINGWLKSKKIIERIEQKHYSILEGSIDKYIPSDNYNRKNGSFYVNNHKFISRTSYGFTSDLYLNNIVLRNGYKVKIYYSGNIIFKFWLVSCPNVVCQEGVTTFLSGS